VVGEDAVEFHSLNGSKGQITVFRQTVSMHLVSSQRLPSHPFQEPSTNKVVWMNLTLTHLMTITTRTRCNGVVWKFHRSLQSLIVRASMEWIPFLQMSSASPRHTVPSNQAPVLYVNPFSHADAVDVVQLNVVRAVVLHSKKHAHLHLLDNPRHCPKRFPQSWA
jgi:hypothetical protein